MVEKEFFLGEIFEMEILMDLHVMWSPESKNYIFSVQSVSMCVCVSLCLCVCASVVSVISITPKKLQKKHQIWYSKFVSKTDAT